MTHSPSPAVTVDFGGTAIRIIPDEPERLPDLRHRYGPFVCDERRPGVTLRWSSGFTGFELDTSDPAAAVLRGSGRLRELDAALRGWIPELADGVTFHAAMLRLADRAVICCGYPGAGKSTLAGLFPEASCCDESAVVDRALIARSLPFWTACPASAPLGAVLILEHGTVNRRFEIPQREAFRELSRHVFWPEGRPAAMRTALETLADIAQTVPVWRLQFRPTTEVWTVIEEAVA